MKSKHHFFSLAALALSLGLSFASCTDNCLDANGGKGDGKDSEVTDKAHQARQTLLCLLGMTADVDSLPDNWNNGYTAEPTIGQEASEGNPYVRLVATSSVEDACRYYQFMTSQQSDGTLTSDTWTNDSIGTLKFTAENQTDLYATVDVDVKQLPHLTQIRFVPASALGNNDGEGYWYSPGDIILQELPGEEPTYWMCVRPCIEGSKGRSHWCTFQLNSTTDKNPNFAEFEGKKYGKLTLPTKLAKSQGDAARMIQHYFTELLLLADPARYSNADITSFGELGKTAFTATQLRDLKYMWDELDIWNTIAPTIDLQKKFNVTHPQAYVFYNGYSRSFNLLSHNDYTTYCLALLPVKNGKAAETFATANELEVEVDPEVGAPKDFSTINANGGVMGFNLTADRDDDLPDANKKKVYVVKHRTGAQLENRWLPSDNHPEESLTQRTTSNHITDILVQKKTGQIGCNDKDFLPFFAYGDKVVCKAPAGAEAVCVRPAPYRSFNEISGAGGHVAYCYFITNNSSKKEFVNYDYISLDYAKNFSTMMLDAYLYQLGDNAGVQPIIRLSEHNDIYEKGATNLYNLIQAINKENELVTYAHGTDVEGNKAYSYYSVTTNFWALIPSSNTGKNDPVKVKTTLRYYPDGKPDSEGQTKKFFFCYEAAADEATCLEVVYTGDDYTYTEEFSQSRTLVVDGGGARRYYKDALKSAVSKLEY